MKIKTLEDARRFVLKEKVCTIFPSDKVSCTSLYEHVDLPEKQPGESGWGQRMEAVWPWKNQLPTEYPNEIYYGKIKGGFAVLMEMNHLADEHFPDAYKPAESLNQLAQQVYDRIRIEPWTTTDLRNEMVRDLGCSKSQFDTALKNLQITLNIVRACDAEQDTWLTFREVYTDIWNRHVDEDD